MSDMNVVGRMHQVLIAPIVSEKTAASGERENSVTFWVAPSATKADIKKAVEYFFPEAKVESVRTAVLHRPFKQFANKLGRGKKRKKAYVKLMQGTEIQFTEFE